MSIRSLVRALVFLTAFAVAAAAHASYAQMRLDGIGYFFAFALIIVHGAIVDVAVLAGLFRYRVAVAVGVLVALAVIHLLVGPLASPGDRPAFLQALPGGGSLVVLLVTGAVILPFVLVAPIAQFLAMRRGVAWPRWITVWMVLQFALVPGFIVLWFADDYFWQRDYVAGQAVGGKVGAGDLGGILALADQRGERIWGTPWSYPWRRVAAPGALPAPSGWNAGLASGLDASALIAAEAPLGAQDRAALGTLIDRHLRARAIPRIHVKLRWDALEPGGFARSLAPAGVDEAGAIGEQEIPVLVERLERDGGRRMCPGGRMIDADRAVLSALIRKSGRVWNPDRREHELRPDAAELLRRVERVCRATT